MHCCPKPSPSVARRRSRALGMRHFDVQLIGGMVLHDGKIAEMRTGEGKTLIATLAVLPERARRQGRSRRHGQRLPGQPRRRLDGQGLPLPRHDGGRHPVAAGDRRQAARVCGRHHLRHQQRVRLRLPARQHGVRGRRPAPARTELRDRRRGRLDPDRRGAHAADHLGPGRGPHRALPADERSCRRLLDEMAAEPKAGEEEPPGDFWVDEKAHQVLPVRGRPREGRGDPGAAWACCPRAPACTTPATSA